MSVSPAVGTPAISARTARSWARRNSRSGKRFATSTVYSTGTVSYDQSRVRALRVSCRTPMNEFGSTPRRSPAARVHPRSRGAPIKRRRRASRGYYSRRIDSAQRVLASGPDIALILPERASGQALLQSFTVQEFHHDETREDVKSMIQLLLLTISSLPTTFPRLPPKPSILTRTPSSGRAASSGSRCSCPTRRRLGRLCGERRLRTLPRGLGGGGRAAAPRNRGRMSLA